MNNKQFYALISRMKYITRWSLMRNSIQENIQEHSHMTAVIAHGLGVIGNRIYGKAHDPAQLATIALFHDATEILTGDMPTPIKYQNPDIIKAYQQVEAYAADRLVQMLPKELQADYTLLLGAETHNSEVYRLVKAADKRMGMATAGFSVQRPGHIFRCGDGHLASAGKGQHLALVSLLLQSSDAVTELK